MDHIRNSQHWSQNSLYNKYDQHLSPFGRKVLATLSKLKDEPKYKSSKPFYLQPQPRYQNKQVLQFNEHCSPKSPYFYNPPIESNTCEVDNNNFHIVDSSPLNSTSSNLLITHDSNLKDDNIKLNFNENNSSGDFQMIHSSDSSTNNIQSHKSLVNLGFHQILDINDIFGCVDETIIDKSTQNQLDTEKFCLNSVAPENKINNDNVNCNTQNFIMNPVKHKNIRNVQYLKEKKSEVTERIHEKNSNTSAIKSWLNDVHPKNKEEDDQNVEELPSYVIDGSRSKVQKNKKKIQAQLVNKQGIMKYSKPKDLETSKRLERYNTELKDVITESSAIKNKSFMNQVAKKNKVRAKFIAPIKSQVPVRDIEYQINVISDSYFKEFENELSAVENEDIVITLVFSNGFCQLNNLQTDNTCIPEAMIINVYDKFYYLKGVGTCITSAFCRLMSTNTLICYDAKKIFLFLYNNLEAIKMSVIFDAKIGGSLISPDEPPETFSDIQKLLSITPDYDIATECVLQRTAWYMTLLKESARKLKEMMVENSVYNLFVNIEMKILPIIAGMERLGVRVDVSKLKSMEGVLMSRMKEVEAECHEAAGKPFQINSTLQVRTILYDELKLDIKCKIKIQETVSKGAKSTSEIMLRSLSAVHPLPGLILEYRHLHKAHATFAAGIAQHVVDGVVKPTWDQTAAATGRMSSSNPNLQAIPRKSFNLVSSPREAGTESPKLKFRSVYASRAGCCLLAADYKQLECRVFAHLARDHALENALRATDLFTALAAQWLCKSEGSVSLEDRSLTKRVVYAILYGAGARTLGHVLQGTDQQLLGVIDSFNKTFPSLKSFAKSVVSECESRGGRLITPSGRTRIFKNIFSTDFALRSQAERRAVNFIIQGTAADLCKRAMVLANEQLPAGDRLLLQLHDELVWEVRRHRLHTSAAIIKSAMESCGREFRLALALPVAMYYGDNWGEMEEFIPCD